MFQGSVGIFLESLNLESFPRFSTKHTQLLENPGNLSGKQPDWVGYIIG